MTSTPMAVVAPDLTSAPAVQAAHVPDIHPQHSDDEANGAAQPKKGGAKRIASSDEEDEKPLAKKPRASAVAARRKVIDSDSESEEDAPPVKNGNGKKAVASSDLSSDEDDAPLAKRPAPVAKSNGMTKLKAKSASVSSASSSDDDAPLAKSASQAKASKPASKNARASTSSTKAKGGKPRPSYKDDSDDEDSISDSESDSEDEKPLAKKAKAKAAPAAKKANGNGNGAAKPKAKVNVKKELSESEDDKPLAKKAAAKGRAKVEKDVKPDVKPKGKKAKEEEDEEEKYKWWEEHGGDGSTKWSTLIHNGVLFPPAYIPLPKGVKMKYDGQSLTLPPESEEVAGFWAAKLETDHARDATFQANFFRDFKAVLKDFPPKEGVKVEKLSKCDFKPMFEYFEREKEKKKTMTKEEKKQLKEEKEEMEKPYLYATVDGRKEKLGNFRAEPPGLFLGRGEHPRKGTLKLRLRPEDITINIGEDAPVPIPNIPGKWKAVKHDPTVTWLAEWKENVNGNTKYVFLAAGSSWKGQSDRQKFEKARELIKHVDRIRKDYTADLHSKAMQDRQRATALYFIDKLALRAGNEKGEDEADTYGCCSLLFEHLTLEPPNIVHFDFLGKDSMRFEQRVPVDAQIFKNIKIFKQNKDRGDQIFDRLTTSGLNKYLTDQMPGLTAKVFRTYNASWTFQVQLGKNTPKKGTVQEKILAYNKANKDVAILCNHQKTVSKGFAESFAKMGDKVRALKYQRMRLRLSLFQLNPKAKKKHPELAELESDMDDDFMERHEADLVEKALEGAKKKFEKDNIKLEEQKEPKLSKGDLDARLKEIKAEFKEMIKERKSKKVEPKKGATEEKLLDQIAKMDQRIATAKVQLVDRDSNKDVALGTSKINYIDPRLTVAWARKNDVPIEKLFSKTLREKFPWAEAEADADWVF